MIGDSRAVSEGSPAERWLASHVTAIALVLAALGMLARLRAADAPFLQPDEVLHVRIASAPSLSELYRESLTNAHPPLFYVLLRPWTSVAHSDWTLRLLPAAFGTAFLWFAWLWARAALGVPSGLIVLACLAFMGGDKKSPERGSCDPDSHRHHHKKKTTTKKSKKKKPTRKKK